MGLLSFLLGNTDKANNKYAQSKKEYQLREERSNHEQFRILRYLDARHEVALLRSEGSGNVYQVSASYCQCQDFARRGGPCKHMMYFRRVTGRKRGPALPDNIDFVSGDGGVIPVYTRYYKGPPTGMGYLNLYSYEVTGRSYGTSKKTGKPTNQKKVVHVNAISEEDALVAAAKKNVQPPYSNVRITEAEPSDAQQKYAENVGIPLPMRLTAKDISALLTRYQESDGEICPETLFQMATQRRISVSYFASPQMVINMIWYCCEREDLSALYCYTVYCKEKGCEFGKASVSSLDKRFLEFKVAPQQQKYIESFSHTLSLSQMNRKSKAYISAEAFLRTEGMI